jgi:hypothetical protein
MSTKASRPAMVPVDHPLCYSSSPRASDWTGLRTKKGKPQKADSAALLQRTVDRQDIVNLLNEYAYVLDKVMVDHAASEEWANTMTEDAVVTFPFGVFKGRESMAQMCLDAETRFERMIVCQPHGVSARR